VKELEEVLPYICTLTWPPEEMYFPQSIVVPKISFSLVEMEADFRLSHLFVDQLYSLT